MLKTVVAGVVLVLAVLILLPSSYSIVPNLINYQGRLQDSVGDPVDGTYMIRFRILNSQSGGTELWSETHPSVTITDGLFEVLLGSQGPGLPQTVFSSTTAWLEIILDGDTLSPRTQFTTSAYSHRVTTVDGAEAGEISGDLVVSGKVKAGDAIEPYGGIVLPSGITIQSTAGNVMVIAGTSLITVSPSGGVTIQSSTVELNATDELILSASNKVAIEAPWVDLHSTDSTVVRSDQQIKINSGTVLTAQAGTFINTSAGIQTNITSSSITNVTAGTTLDLNGSLVTIN